MSVTVGGVIEAGLQASGVSERAIRTCNDRADLGRLEHTDTLGNVRVRHERFISVVSEQIAAIVYGVLGLRTLLARHAEPRHAFMDLVRDARFAFRRPDLESVTLTSSTVELGLSMLPRNIHEQAGNFAARFLAPTPQAAYVVGSLLAMTLLKTDVEEGLVELRTGRSTGAAAYRGLTYGQRATTDGARAVVSELRGLFKGVPRRRISKILRDAEVFADVHDLYGDSLGDALLGAYKGRSRSWLSRATAPFFAALGMPLARGPKVG